MAIPRRPFGPMKVKVPVVGQGTWLMEQGDRREVISALRRGLDLGLTHVDTAEMYGHGEVESLLGEALLGRREEVFLVSKVLPVNASREGTMRACEQSLRRLRTGVLDLYLLHWPSTHPLEGTLAAFEALRAEGKIRAYGVSNFDEAELEEAVRLAGPGQISCNQVLHHLGERHVEAELLEVCSRHQVALVGYSPFGSGSFPSERSRGGKVLAEVARRHHATPHQIALALLVREPGTFTIPKAAKVAHVEENAAAAALLLSGEDVALLDAAFPVKRRRSLPVI